MTGQVSPLSGTAVPLAADGQQPPLGVVCPPSGGAQGIARTHRFPVGAAEDSSVTRYLQAAACAAQRVGRRARRPEDIRRAAELLAEVVATMAWWHASGPKSGADEP